MDFAGRTYEAATEIRFATKKRKNNIKQPIKDEKFI